MILVDLNQIIFSTLAATLDKVTVDENLIRHMVLNVIRSNRQKFASTYGELVLCCDSRKYWRKEVFPYYKANRKKARENSGLNWPAIFEAMNVVKSELREYFPYKMIEVEGAEADDVIAVIVQHLPNQEEVLTNNLNSMFGDAPNTFMILSSDKDFIQLHRPGTTQYNPIHKTWVSHPDPKVKLFEHIIKGDKGDGIPNVRCSDDSLVKGERAKPITSKLIEELTVTLDTQHPLYRNYVRNKQLIDLTCIPNNLQQNILTAFEEQQSNGRGKLFDYFIDRGLKHLISEIGDF